jgi:hypothetical protein
MVSLSKIPGFKVEGYQPSLHEAMLREMQGIASASGMEVPSCAEGIALSHLGIKPGKCIDDEYIEAVFGIDVTHRKDKGQREACGCVESRDIGVYDTCILGCQYCYATSSFDKALINYKKHDKDAPSLISIIEEEHSHSDGFTRSGS